MSIQDLYALIFKTIICYGFLFLILKVMGKREVGELSMFDIVCYLVIAELFSLSLNDIDNSILYSLIPVMIIVILQIFIAKISLKSRKWRKYMEGVPSFLIYNGKIDMNEMKKNRYNIDDLFLQLRNQNIQSPEEVQFAILENNGNLNIITKKNNKLIDPLPLIADGEINIMTLNRIGMSIMELELLLRQHSIEIKDVFILLMMNNGPFILTYEKFHQEE